MDTLILINTYLNNDLYHENYNYLYCLEKSMQNINEHLNDIDDGNNNNNSNNININIVTNKLEKSYSLKFKKYHDIEQNKLKYFLPLIIENIKILINDIPDYNNIHNKDNIYEEYNIFHNTVIEKIENFINYYEDYYNYINDNKIKLTNLHTNSSDFILEKYNHYTLIKMEFQNIHDFFIKEFKIIENNQKLKNLKIINETKINNTELQKTNEKQINYDDNIILFETNKVFNISNVITDEKNIIDDTKLHITNAKIINSNEEEFEMV